MSSGVSQVNRSSAANVGGVIQLVSAAHIDTNLPSLSMVPLFAGLTVHTTPDPDTLLLFGFGIAALGIAARTRKKKWESRRQGDRSSDTARLRSGCLVLDVLQMVEDQVGHVIHLPDPPGINPPSHS